MTMHPENRSTRGEFKGAAENLCPRCGAAFACGMATGEHPCWCAGLPPLIEGVHVVRVIVPGLQIAFEDGPMRIGSRVLKQVMM